MSEVLLTKRVEFAAAHRYHNEAWDAARNRTVFGACNNEHGHGHNYLLEVTVAGPVDDRTGMVVNLYDLKEVLLEVLEEFDHKHLNLDTPYFTREIPTGENLAHVLWGILERHQEIGRLERVRLYEDEDLWADVTAEMVGRMRVGGAKLARLTRRYNFSAGHGMCPSGGPEGAQTDLYGKCGLVGSHGHDYVLEVTVLGEVDTGTGMITDLKALDRLVGTRVLHAFEGRELAQLPELTGLIPSGENLVRVVWTLLEPDVPRARLTGIRLYETPETYYEYSSGTG